MRNGERRISFKARALIRFVLLTRHSFYHRITRNKADTKQRNNITDSMFHGWIYTKIACSQSSLHFF